MGCMAVKLVAGVFAVAALSSALATTPPQQNAAVIERGRVLFFQCNACHSVKPPARPQTGPHLEHIVGRTVASVPGYRYSPMLKAKTFVWSRDKLDLWLRNPQEGFPGMCVPFRGMSSKTNRKALIAYLEHGGSHKLH